MKHKIGIIGHGFVGLAVETGLQTVADIRIHDKYKDTESLESVVKNSDILFLCLPTPMNEDGSCNISIIEEVLEEIDFIEPGKTIIIKSTVPPGTTKWFSQEYKNHAFIFNPEFLTEKNFIQDFLDKDRIIIGFASKNNFRIKYDAVIQLYQDFMKTQRTSAFIFATDSTTAEMTKYIANCFFSTKVIFFNEMKQICDAAEIDFEDAVKMAILDPRIGKSHYKVPGPDGKHGFGGSCFPKDINALIVFAEENGVDPMLLESVWSKNLLLREEYEWEKLAQVTGEYKKKE